jgi:hypothetical protein
MLAGAGKSNGTLGTFGRKTRLGGSLLGPGTIRTQAIPSGH